MASNEKEAARIRFDGALYSVDSIKRAAYALADRLDVEITTESGDTVCLLRTRKPTEQLELIEQEFRQSVQDYDLRSRISKETEPMRNLILAMAFSKTGLQG